jgi:hypothetical protein
MYFRKRPKRAGLPGFAGSLSEAPLLQKSSYARFLHEYSVAPKTGTSDRPERNNPGLAGQKCDVTFSICQREERGGGKEKKRERMLLQKSQFSLTRNELHAF